MYIGSKHLLNRKRVANWTDNGKCAESTNSLCTSALNCYRARTHNATAQKKPTSSSKLEANHWVIENPDIDTDETGRVQSTNYYAHGLLCVYKMTTTTTSTGAILMSW